MDAELRQRKRSWLRHRHVKLQLRLAQMAQEITFRADGRKSPDDTNPH